MELKARTARSIADEEEMLELGADCPIEQAQVYLKSDVDKILAEKDKEIEGLKHKGLDVKDVTHVLKAFNFYRCMITHCAYDGLTAQWIMDNWEQDYERVEAYKG